MYYINQLLWVIQQHVTKNHIAAVCWVIRLRYYALLARLLLKYASTFYCTVFESASGQHVHVKLWEASGVLQHHVHVKY